MDTRKMTNKASLSRRSFLKGTATGAAVLGATSLFACTGNGSADGKASSTNDVSWDKETDVVIIGYGFAGACAAIAAQDEGASVIVVEKAPTGGGNSAASVGAIHTAIKVNDLDSWIKSRIEGALGTVPDNVMKAAIEAEQEIPSWLEDDLGMEINWIKAAYGEMAQIISDGEVGNGKVLFEFFADQAEQRGAEVLTSTPAKRLVQDAESHEILGVIVEQDGAEVAIKASKGVILSCGGYENNQEMQAQYHYPGIPFIPWGTPYNTGDGIKMASVVGADMWHFSCFEYAGLAPKKPYEEMEGNPVFSLNYNNHNFYAKNKTGNFMLVNQEGKRFMNENWGIGHQKTTLPFNNYSEEEQKYVNYPFFFVCDETMVKSGPLAPTPLFGSLPFTYAGHNTDYEWSADNSAEIEKGWILKADTIEELASKIGADPASLQATISDFNSFAESGADGEFARPADSMAPLATPPFYATECMLSIINTMGGPVRNEKCQTIGVDGEPVPRLYNAGEMGSLNGGILYIMGNIAEAITSGRVAGSDAAKLNSLGGSSQ